MARYVDGSQFRHPSSLTETQVYVEASIQPGGFEKTAVLQSISLEGYRIFRLNFWYHMYGTAIASLRVQILVAGSWTTLWEKSGDQAGKVRRVGSTSPFSHAFEVVDVHLLSLGI